MMMPSQELPPNGGTRLVSWKEIAAFFRVTVRTVQNWESERGLPVHRIPGSRGRVYADTSELIEWQSRFETLPPKIESEEEAPEVEAAEAEPPARSRRWVFASAVLLVVVSAAAWRLWPAKPQGVGFRLEGSTLIVLDRAGMELGRHVFDEQPLSNDEISALGLSGQYLDLPKFLDIDGDGRNELVFPHRSRGNRSEHDELFVFSNKGDFLWKYRCEEQVRTKKHTYTRNYGLNHFGLLSYPGQRGVLVTFRNNPSDASVLMLLSAEGKPMRRYWHSGHISALQVFDRDNDGVPEIYLGAIANNYGATDLIVLDPRNFGGASLEDEENQIQDQGPPVEQARLLIPRTRLSRAILKYNMLSTIRYEADQIRLEVQELPGEPTDSTTAYYQLDRSLRLVDVHVGDITATMYRRWYDRGTINFLWDESELIELRKIRYLTPLR